MTLATQILIAAHRTLEHSWKHDCIAQTEAGEEIYFRDPSATRFSSYAAVMLAAQRLQADEMLPIPYVHEALNRRPGPWGDWLSWEWAAERTKEEVLAMIAQAIEFSVEDERYGGR